MTQWQQIRMLDSVHREQVHRLYSDDCLPMEVREYLAYWIEEQNWNQVVQFNRSQAYYLLQTMLTLLDDQLGRFAWQAENDVNMVIRHNLRRSKLSIQTRYQDHPEELANIIDGLLREEKAILSAAVATSPSRLEPPPDAALITGHENNIEDRLVEMRRAVQGLKSSIEQLEDLQETFHFRYTAFKILERSMPSDPSLTNKLKEVQAMINNLDSCRKDVLDRIQTLLGRSDTLRDLLLTEVAMWQDRQRQACIGDVCDTSLQQLERWCTRSAEDLFHLLWLLQTLEELPQKVTYVGDPLPDQLPQLRQRLQEQIFCLLKSSFVVESQPKMPYPSRRPLVLKTNQKFGVCVRLLVKLMDPEHKMEVKIEIDRDSANLKGFRRFNILPSNTKTMMKDRPQVEGLVCDFSHIMLKEQKCCGSGKGKGSKGANEGSLPITEELHVFTFTLDYCYQGLKCQLQTSTLPVVIISNANQASSAWASILWFNMLGADPKNQLFFSSPPTTTWAKLSKVLSWQFSNTTKRGLDLEQLKMLGEKISGAKVTPQSTITWAQFCKTGDNFSFWTWLDEILNLIQQHLLELWNNNLIMGFVSRKREKQLLKKKQAGTFLLRFSETTRGGGITCTWVEYEEDGTATLRSVMPYTRKDLEDLALPDFIHDYKVCPEEDIPEHPLQFLYPDTPRNEAFGPYYSERREGDLGEPNKYLNRRLIRISSRHQDEPSVLEVDPEEPRVLGVKPEEPCIPGVNPEEPRIPGVNPEEPHVLNVNPEKPRVQRVNPEEPRIPGVNPEEPCVPGVIPEEPHVLGMNKIDMDQVNALFGNVMLNRNDPFLPAPGEEEQLEYSELFRLPDEIPELNLDESDF
ncbi:signal transducer and activator of transcription 2 isoform X2 [Sphaerodactylus townsendi]|uniref:signal transducer and activator of transcription 2 isoform X2 n=1 Tax=Sphaerodactylus townsendi TaxID=933632 RepID=UPI002025BB95|nr:signal transducer and activator of transcription 2 isoform X2 [Sphaerodactylus townsendi]